MFDNTFLDKRYFDDILARMTDRLQFCPEEWYLEHAEFGFGSVLSHEEEITTVLDWGKLGVETFRSTWPGWIWECQKWFFSLFRNYYTSTERDVPDFG